jgi:hypothetical protein
MLVNKWSAIITGTLVFYVVALAMGCGCDEDDNAAGVYKPYDAVYVDGGRGPTLFVDRNGDGVNDLCADVQVQASRATPIVTFVIDGSSSMDRTFQNSRSSRWNAMVTTLMDRNNGIVYTLQNDVVFGLVLFSGPADNCPDLRTVAPALNNYDAINQVISGYSPSGTPKYTPTAQALEAAYALQPDIATLDRDLGQHFIILCTDGNPNSCEAAQSPTTGGDPPPEFDGPIQQVTAGSAQGITTFIISLASEGPEYEQHLSQLADIGDPGTPAFSPNTPDALVAKMEQLVGGALGCQVTLNGKVTPGDECSGQVVLNGEALGCNDPNGWKLVDEKTIELVGTACERFMNDPTSLLEAGFPCNVFDPEIII